MVHGRSHRTSIHTLLHIRLLKVPIWAVVDGIISNGRGARSKMERRHNGIERQKVPNIALEGPREASGDSPSREIGEAFRTAGVRNGD